MKALILLLISLFLPSIAWCCLPTHILLLETPNCSLKQAIEDKTPVREFIASNAEACKLSPNDIDDIDGLIKKGLTVVPYSHEKYKELYHLIIKTNESSDPRCAKNSPEKAGNWLGWSNKDRMFWDEKTGSCKEDLKKCL
jgi:hypothetical protein